MLTVTYNRRMFGRLLHRAVGTSSINRTRLAAALTATRQPRLLSTNSEANETITGTTPSTSPSLDALKEQLLEASLLHVPHHGWTQTAIITACMGRGVSLSVAGLITPNDLIRYAMDQFYNRLQQDLQQQNLNHHHDPSSSARESIQQAIQLRLSYQKDYLHSQTWHQGMALGASPDNALQTQEQLKQLINLITHHAYGTSQQQQSVSELAKLTLGGVYVATELHMLTDSSPDFADTWAFLEQRLVEWEQIANLSSPSTDALYVTTAVASAMASGLASLVQPMASQAISNLPSGLQNSLSQAPEQLWSTLVNQQTTVDGTDPSFYNVVREEKK